VSEFIHATFDAIFGCRHADLSRPFTLRHQTYKVCLECGREIPYSLATMSVVTGRDHASAVRVAAAAQVGAL
jgi:hypothetical protein